MNIGFVVIVLISVFIFIVRYLLIRKTRRKFRELHSEVLKEQEAFLKSFNIFSFNDFSAFDFAHGSVSHVSPFPSRINDEWRYRIYLMGSEVDDVVTVSHEICECTLGRVIEKLLQLEKPLYLVRKEQDKFWVHGRKQKYLVEHVLATLGEIDDLTLQMLRQRLNKEDAEAWIN